MPSLDAAAEVLAAGLADGWPDGDLVRVLAQAVEDFDRCAAGGPRDGFLAEPRSTGSSTWDAALAALAVHLCRREGRETTPAWTREPTRFAPHMTWIGLTPHSGLAAYALQRTPAYFKSRGVILNADNLVSV